ncbi:hypothetical protein ACUOA5_43910, partial [Escherichia coli]
MGYCITALLFSGVIFVIDLPRSAPSA